MGEKRVTVKGLEPDELSNFHPRHPWWKQRRRTSPDSFLYLNDSRLISALNRNAIKDVNRAP